MRTIGVVTTSRADYGIYLPILREVHRDPDLRLQLFVSGMHLSPEFGMTVDLIEKDGFPIAERVECLLSADSPSAVAIAMGLATIGFANAFERSRPDILVILGDRFEMHGAAVAALPAKIPVAHIHGGEVTQGAIDDALRHSLTKLSHLHFVSTSQYARRVRQLGEEFWRITVSGAPSLDNLRTIELWESDALSEKYGLILDPPPLLVTFHPETLDYENTQTHLAELLAALDASGLPIVFTMPNADTGGRSIASMMREFAQDRDKAWFFTNLGTQGYFSLMAKAAAMVGNSSSGIIEAPSFALPVVNIGNRQQGRVRAANIIDVGHSSGEISAAIETATSPTFRDELDGLKNSYGDGHAAERIVARLKSQTIDRMLIEKPFVDVRWDDPGVETTSFGFAPIDPGARDPSFGNASADPGEEGEGTER